jgi:RNA polymerase sigma-70 factor, ECF subfamily
MDQRVLVEQAMRGDPEAFAEVVRPAIARLETAARLILRDPELAHDAVQDALIRCWRDLRSLRDPERFEAWLSKLTANASIDLVRRRRSRPVEVEITELQSPWIGDDTGSVADRDVVDRVMRDLDPGQRAVVVLHYYLGMPLTDISGALGIPTGTAKSRLHRALEQMRASIPDDARPTSISVHGRPA